MDPESNFYICDFEDEFINKDKRKIPQYVKLIYQTSYIFAGVLTVGIIIWSIIDVYRE